jgi:hypothetical protein
MVEAGAREIRELGVEIRSPGFGQMRASRWLSDKQR